MSTFTLPQTYFQQNAYELDCKYPSLIANTSEMIGIDIEDLFSLNGKQLQPRDVEQLKYILEDSFTGKSEAYLEPIRSSVLWPRGAIAKFKNSN